MTDLALSNISRLYGAKAAVEDLSLEVRDGEFLSLLGPSGCGKSTTLSLIAGLDQPTRGEIRVGSVVVARGEDKFTVPPESRDLGLVPQSYALWPHMTVGGNVAFPLKLRRVAKRDREARVGEALELVEMAALKERYPHELSGGQQQRVAIARTLVYQPKVLLLDEPLSNLDAKLRDRARQWLRKLQRELKMTTVFVTHDQSEALSLSDRVAVMDSGKLAQLGTPQDIYHSPTTPFVADFVGTCSFLHAKVAAVCGDGRLVVAVEGLTEIEIPQQKHAFAAGEPISLALRPEWVVTVSDPSAVCEGDLRADIEAVEFVGSKFVHTARVGTQPLRFEAPEAMAGTLWLRADSSKLVAFAAAS